MPPATKPGAAGARACCGLPRLWLGGVGTVAIVSFGLRLWLAPKSSP